MNILSRRPASERPGLIGPGRVDRRTDDLVSRLRPGDIAVIEHPDLDRSTAQAMVDRGVAAVVNAAPMLSGRHPAAGPTLLAEHGIAMVDTIGSEGLDAVSAAVSRGLPRAGSIRLHEGTVLVKDRAVANGRELDLHLVRRETDRARATLLNRWEAFTLTGNERLRREQALILDGTGAPQLNTPTVDRAMVVVTRAADGSGHLSQLRTMRHFLRDQDPVVVAVDRAADDLLRLRIRVDVVVVSGERYEAMGALADPDERPSREALTRAVDVVVRLPHGSRPGSRAWEQLEVRPHLTQSTMSTVDLALLLGQTGRASVVVRVGAPAALQDRLSLDGAEPGTGPGTGPTAAGEAVLLALGPRLVDASTLPHLSARTAGSARATWRWLFLALVALLAVVVAVATTPVGHGWLDDLGLDRPWDAVTGALTDGLARAGSWVAQRTGIGT